MFEENDSNVKVDNEQKQKEADTLQLLVSAGYFRARIKGLSSFDKIVGGMTWCIQGCNVTIDIDLLFQENLNIGKKIALTERIVRVLKKMKCPHRIEPHQIQGLDCIHVYPVVQWLVKEALGKQDERMADMKILSCQYFDRNSSFIVPEESKENDNKATWNCNIVPLQDSTNIVEFLQKAYFPQRRYKKPLSMKNVSEEVSVVSTLLEYGKREILASISISQGQEGDKNVQSNDQALDPANSIDKLQNQMSSQVKESTKMAAKLVSKLLELKFGDVQEAVEEYEAKSTLLVNSTQNKAITLTKAIENAQLDLENVQENCAEMEFQIKSLRDKIAELKPIVTEKMSLLTELKEKINEVNQICPEDININEVQIMVEELNSLKEEEQLLKSSCKNEDEQLSLELMKLSNYEEPVEDQEIIARLQESLIKEKKRLQNGRLRLATKARELKKLEIFLDDIPTKREIQQYHKRFIELNTEISNAFSENKQLYDMYNILDSVKDCLQREVNLLNSIYDNFKESMQYTYSKEQIIQQMQEVANAIREFKKNGENQKEKIKAERDQKKEEYNVLVEKSRQYTKLTKNLQETWQYYDKLLQKCQELGVDIDGV